ncbi:hypothetical protein E4U42_000710 [Claviceps africana]|uniref:Dol-P-Glc:Glc(2)Man(9)GlcNAc(2)-PP-Dol alpha-1,2-glucosyltransferase n=1 Tax=Claviceps africana TaxID=83212 RepID=A0A8K0JCE0_9HYPO|nr:hypothetical protein E4U42_000710 [Claviceps africana]
MASNTRLETFSTTSLVTLILFSPVVVFLSRQTEARKHICGILVSFSCVILLSVAWFTLVSHAVPQPYLDEIFHIPQAQRYCEGRLLEWDDKITTPPGLYIFSVLVQNAAKATGIPWLSQCGAGVLRFTNVLGLTVLAYLALLCRHEIEARRYDAHSSARPKPISTCAIHTAVNIALFPLLFFFSGLYYTDVISTAVVVAAFLNHLKRVGRDRSSWMSDLSTAFLGIAALCMRQTNVFWVVVWMGGLEAIHAIKTLKPERVDRPSVATPCKQLEFYSWRYSAGDVHDPLLGLAWPDDMLFTIISLGIAALCNPVRVVRQIWPYMAVLAAFVGFVAWNGGVVLGDKSNHVATIHLAQMLYIWPFFAFFSLPLLLPCAVPLVKTAIRLFRVKPRHPREAADLSSSLPRGGNPKEQSASGKGGIVSNDNPGLPSRLVSDNSSLAKPPPALRSAYMINTCTCLIFWLLYLLATVAASAVVVRFNTIVHPFTLADNRHYMFYIFRYTIRRGNLVRYLLIVPYTVTRWMVWATLAGFPDWTSFAHNTPPSPSSRPSTIPKDTKNDAEPSPGPVPRPHAQDLAETTPPATSRRSIPTSTALVFLLATALSLVTAPLVEPRYFIIPWVMWRLLVPAWRPHDHFSTSTNPGGPKAQSQSCTGPLRVAMERYDTRLVLETIWLLAINVATGYVFLTKPYVWKDENGQVLDGGRLQRFMW